MARGHRGSARPASSTSFSGGTALSSLVSEAGNQAPVNFQGLASATSVSLDGVEYVDGGGSATGTALGDLGFQSVSGGATFGTVVNSGGIQGLHSGGVADATLISGGGSAVVFSTGIASNTSVFAAARWRSTSGGSAFATSVFSSGIHGFLRRNDQRHGPRGRHRTGSGGTVVRHRGAELRQPDRRRRLASRGPISGAAVAQGIAPDAIAPGVTSLTVVGSGGDEIVSSGGLVFRHAGR